MTLPATVPDMIAEQARATPSALVLVAPERDPLDYAGLARQVETTAEILRSIGIARADRVALVLRGGADAATAFLGTCMAAIAAPLNPDYLAAEFETYFESLRAKAVILEEDRLDDGMDQAAAAARKLGIVTIALRPRQQAGCFDLIATGGNPTGAEQSAAKPHDIALLLHTSGTTGKAKLVPLTHTNLLASARAVARTLALTAPDRCLAVMPLFHIHGLVAALLAPLASGGSIVVPQRFHPIDFFSWCETFAPSWYTAVPSMHQVLLARAAQHGAAIAKTKLRFIRSSSAPLAPTVLTELERVFAAPVIESYGMTEAAHQMASNPLPPKPRKPGSVGIAAGPEIAILGDDGNFAPAGTPGEIVIRGPNVTAGYLDNPEANRAAFHDGWFRTGDVGIFDADGYLTLVARVKEIINRGGEKVAPREVEEALLAHESVAEAAAFPVPDAVLGEEVGAAVVLKSGAATSAADLKGFAARRLAYFKLPRHLVIVDSIPKGATGKIQRAGLAGRLGIAARKAAGAADSTPPRNEIEALISALWREVLRVENIGIHAPFLDLGGDSILAAQLVARLREKLAIHLTMADIWDTPTVAAMAARIESKRAGTKRAGLKLGSGDAAAPIPRQHEGATPPLSFAQEWWLSLEDMAPGSPASNRASSVMLEGALDLVALTRAFHDLIARHEILRMTFPLQGSKHAPRIVPTSPITLDVTSFSHLPFADAMAMAHDEIRSLAAEPFALDHAPLWRVRLLRLEPQTHVLAFVVHHALFDGWSMAVLVRDLSALYSAMVEERLADLPALAVQYGDVAAWQRAQLAGSRGRDLELFWGERLRHAPRPPRFPFARKRRHPPSLEGGEAERLLPPALTEALRTLGRAEGATLYMTLLAAFHVLVTRYTGLTDVLTGCLTAGRERMESENLVGLFFNALPMRGDLSGNPSVRQLIARTRDRAVSAFAHEDMPIGRLTELFAPKPDADENGIALVPVLFQLRSFAKADAEAGGVRFAEFKSPHPWARFDLTFDLTESGGGLRCDLAYNADIFTPDHAQIILADFAATCAAFVATPDAPLSALPVPLGAKRS